jgi:dTDP-4-dehydrorhamnose reductase
MRVLVFGSTGQLGRALSRAVWPKETALTFLDRAAADLSEPERLGTIVNAHAPDGVVIAAAYTKVDAAESDEAMAHAVNAAGPAAIAKATAALSVPIVYVSTDYVFDGTKHGFYDEDDAVNPVNAYGRSKAAGETSVRAANPKHLILRTSWVYSAYGANFLSAMLKPAKENREVRVVADQEGCPTAASDLADAISKALPAAMSGEGPYGTFHAAGSAGTTRHGFAEAIFAELRARGLRAPKAVPISTAEYPAPARRPPNGKLSSARLAATFGLRLRGYEEALPSVMDEALLMQMVGAAP